MSFFNIFGISHVVVAAKLEQSGRDIVLLH